MTRARITATRALFALVDDQISGVAREEDMAAEVAEIDALVQDAEREWIAADLEESFRVSRDLTDQVRARRAHRRADRAALRTNLTLRSSFVVGCLHTSGATATSHTLVPGVAEGEVAA
ncbi:hypothetical protein [Amycolatopsis sp. FDAARGOS 1241]|uniref:hypothetical protein n=1 Tax=Amycolatopsis sp. FDAARGOS 1241 TaxID=2778070 RepID=UPI0019521F21|nr:hypothetical protein [Amycolatopsis sp. FDAARGOS 1241]QRP46903.1 hypothetical protein I6J71_02290 [Amycolatopsis sp. FDAARGOS 1241]